jgi:hypothetical protein
MNNEDFEPTRAERHVSEVAVRGDQQNMLSRGVVVKPKNWSRIGHRADKSWEASVDLSRVHDERF